LRVLIIEDDETFCQFLSEILQSRGNEVVSSTDGVDGYEKVWAYSYDLFILDVRMPGLLGTEIAEAIRQKSTAAKIILISAFADETLRQAAEKLRAQLLSKPFSADDLFRVIDRARSEQGVNSKSLHVSNRN
jgi:DNA-binding response OmpR family regulator